MRRFIIILAVLSASVSCSYISPFSNKDTNINFEITELMGTQVVVRACPDDDRVYYTFGVAAVDVVDSLVAVDGERGVYDKTMASVKETYDFLYEYYKKRGDKYIMSFSDYCLYYSSISRRFVGLKPETDYYIIGFCVNSETNEMIGSMKKQRFTTTAIYPYSNPMTIDFMVHDTSEHFYYYAKPIFEGKICRDPYITLLVEDEELAEYPSLKDFALATYNEYLEAGALDAIIKYDISRNECFWIHEPENIGKSFTLLGVPFNIKNIDSLYSLHFVYNEGIHIDYTHTIN